ncbi:MAG: AEC family transporter [Cyclobacteriaceae bacterium]|nr:AEC family transporter [Cyclobacteriaceae bacterium]
MELLLLVVLIIVGAILTKQGWLTQRAIFWANKWIIVVAAPAIALIKIPLIELSGTILAPVIAPIVVFFGSFFLFYVVFKSVFNKEEKLVLTLLSGLGNTSFLGFPLVSAYYGGSYLPYAVVFDQLTFLLLATVAQWLIVSTKGSFSIKNSLIKIITFPPFIALIVAVVLPNGAIDGNLLLVLEKLGSTLSPVAMLIVGYQVARFVDFKFSKPIFYGLGYKLFIAPMLIVGVLYFLKIEEPIFKASVMEAAMAPMVTIAILVSDYKILPKLTAQVLTWGILASFPTTFLWYLILERF